MKHSLSLLILIFTHFSYGQNNEQFIKSIASYFVDTEFTQYHIYSLASQITIDEFESKEVIDSISQSIPPEIIDEFSFKIKTDTSLLIWNCDSLENAICERNGNDIFFNTQLVTIQHNWTSKRKKRQTNKQIRKQKKTHLKKPLQERIIFAFSKPVFNKSGEYALIRVWRNCGNACGSGCIYLFKKNNNSWQCLTKTRCRIS